MDQELNKSRCREIRRLIPTIQQRIAQSGRLIRQQELRLQDAKARLPERKRRLRELERDNVRATSLSLVPPGRVLSAAASRVIENGVAVAISRVEEEIQALEKIRDNSDNKISALDSERKRLEASLGTLSSEASQLNCVI